MGLRPYDDGGTLLDDSRLLGGYLFDRIAQPLHVIHVNRTDDGNIRIQDVGGIPESAHADLNNRHVHGGIRKGPDGHGRQDLEEAHRRPPLLGEPVVDHRDEVLNLPVYIHEALIRQLLPIDGDPLVDPLQVGGGIEACPHAVGAGDGLSHPGR